eukprot:TRINITY_DN447_c0_g1_i12.p1 TRINITY_DN447_c0_g1~~TRINITY_DN447_c0_g1_i12.p1  ORF type:complete len:149 (-),score=37.44 TRINITY_DN447_c0_g1_i12:194-640(-)
MSEILILVLLFVGAIVVLFLKDYLSRPPQAPGSTDRGANQKELELTIEELARYDGVKNKNIYVALKNVIFDVTKSEHYNPVDGSYRIFNGKDASVALGKMKLDNPEYFNSYATTKLSPGEQSILDDWYGRYMMKYPVIGKIVTDKKHE